MTKTPTPTLTHRDGCPAEPNRIESYPVTAPGGGEVTVCRCMTCGAHHPPEPATTGAFASATQSDVTMRRMPGGDAA